MDKAQELYSSMLLRGFTGDFPYAHTRFSLRGLWYPAVCTALFLVFRFVNIPQLLGSLFVR
jgi:cobalt/nickel transport system permease protein